MSEPQGKTGVMTLDPDTPEGKYLVIRRDGTIPEWPNFILGARDPAAPAALREYAKAASAEGMSEAYVADCKTLAGEFEAFAAANGMRNPSAPRKLTDRLTDNPMVLAMMRHRPLIPLLSRMREMLASLAGLWSDVPEEDDVLPRLREAERNPTRTISFGGGRIMTTTEVRHALGVRRMLREYDDHLIEAGVMPPRER